MRKEELFEALAEIDPDSVKKAGAYKKRKIPVWKRGLALAACLVIVVGLLTGLPELKRKEYGAGSSMGLKTVLAAYPEAVGEKLSAEAFMEGDEHYNWWQSYREKLDVSRELQADLKAYNEAMMKELLPSDHENTVCSPLNTYIALAMLAEITDGNSRKQILDLLGTEDMDHLREGITALWESNYVDTPVLKSLLGNSIWMKEGMNYEEETLKRLAESYYVSSFRGLPGSSEMDEALRKWTDENTGGLLSEYTKDMTIKADTVLDLVSTIYYKAMWMDDFWENSTVKETFHGSRGDTTVDMMKKSRFMGIYSGEDYTAIGLNLTDSGSMYFLLPAEGMDVNSLLKKDELLERFEDTDSWKYAEVNLSIPKFKVSSKLDLIDTLSKLGVTDVLDDTKSDFSPLTKDKDNLYLSKAEHAAMVEIDEKGVSGAAYTELAITEGVAMVDEVVDFVLDRPFLFMVTAADGSILFSGAVRNID